MGDNARARDGVRAGSAWLVTTRRNPLSEQHVPISRECLPELWVFLGDSITEGVGSSRVSYVEELAKVLRRQGRKAETVRLGGWNEAAYGSSVPYNFAGYAVADRAREAELILWNLACEGTTVVDDQRWVWFIKLMRPSRVFVLRGPLEFIIRPAHLKDGDWPLWIPRGWRHYAALDPRCYFSDRWWRRAKQQTIDWSKQIARRRLLAERSGAPLVDDERFQNAYVCLLHELSRIGAWIALLGLPMVSAATFPGSEITFAARDTWVRGAARKGALKFIDWPIPISPQQRPDLFYRDGFHPNLNGAQAFAQHLLTKLSDPKSALA